MAEPRHCPAETTGIVISCHRPQMPTDLCPFWQITWVHLNAHLVRTHHQHKTAEGALNSN